MLEHVIICNCVIAVRTCDFSSESNVKYIRVVCIHFFSFLIYLFINDIHTGLLVQSYIGSHYEQFIAYLACICATFGLSRFIFVVRCVNYMQLHPTF